MTLEVADLLHDIRRGLKKSWLTNFRMSDSMHNLIKPEYLTTVCICQKLASSLNGICRIEAEEKTGSIWKATALISWLSRNKWLSLRESKIRKGNVDISLSTLHNGLSIPFAVIENKNFLRFTKEFVLYKQSNEEISKDLDRNIEFLLGENHQGAVEFTALTFYVQDKNSVTKSDGDKFRQCVKQTINSVVAPKLSPCPHLKVHIEVESCADSLFSTHNDAIEPDEDDCPAYVKNPPYHIVYGVITIFSPGSILVYNKGFNRTPESSGPAEPGEFGGGAG